MKTGCALLFAIGLVVLQSCNAQAPNCIGVTNGYTINDPSNDNEYYTCQGNVPIPMLCPSGYVFCSGATYCTAACNIDIPVTAAPATAAPVTAAPVTAAPVTAAPVTAAPTTVAPVTNPPTTAAPVNTVCSGQADGTIFPNSSSCSGYFICSGGLATAGTCLQNFAFDAALGSCSTTAC